MGRKTNILASSVLGSLVLTSRFPGYAPLASVGGNFFVLFLVQIIPLALWSVLVYPYFFSPLRHLPEPKGGTLFNGQFSEILAKPSGEPARTWLETVPHNGLMRYRHALNRERVLVTSPKALSEVLVTRNYDFIKPPQIRNGIGQLLGIGILLAEGEEHKRQRKNLSPAFAFRHIKDLYPSFWAKGKEVSEKMTETLKADPEYEKSGSAVLEVGEWASRVTLDIIGVAGMGHDFNSIQNPESELNVCYRTIFQPDRAGRGIQLMALVIPFWILRRIPSKRNQQLADARQLIRKVCLELIAEKKATLADGKATGKDILSVAIESGGFSDEDLVNQLMTFLAAGHETTASAMSWAAYLLCKHPDIQKKLREEIRANLPALTSGKPVTAADIERLPYLWAFCNETLRFLPSVALTLRIAAHDTTILDQPIPKGTTIILCPWAINVDKAQWGPDADQFNPDRWMAAGKANTGGAESNYSLLTFLHGPRSCIGKDFAKAEFATLLATWVGRFGMEFADKDYVLDIGSAVTSKPKGGLKVRLTALDDW